MTDPSSSARIGVIGAGTMGRGIAECAAVHGLEVVLVEVSKTQQQRAQEAIALSLQKAVERSKIDQETARLVPLRISFHETLAPLSSVPIVIEAILEDEQAKRALFQELDQLCAPKTVLSSNTSSISIDRLAEATNRPKQVAGMHFFNPVPVMEPVEIVRGNETSQETLDLIKGLATRMGKRPLIVRDRPGFVVNRVLMPMINEAIWLLQEETASAGDIDSLMRLGCRFPMGPLELADFVGLDVCLSILQILHRDLEDEKFRPCPLLVDLVAQGKLGRKTGAGFFDYRK